MEIFNIQIDYQQEKITLTVTQESNLFKLIYNGGFIGGLQQVQDEWEWINEQELEVKDLPLLSEKKGLANEEIKLSTLDINRITAAIEKHKNQNIAG